MVEEIGWPVQSPFIYWSICTQIESCVWSACSESGATWLHTSPCILRIQCNLIVYISWQTQKPVQLDHLHLLVNVESSATWPSTSPGKPRIQCNLTVYISWQESNASPGKLRIQCNLTVYNVTGRTGWKWNPTKWCWPAFRKCSCGAIIKTVFSSFWGLDRSFWCSDPILTHA